MGLQFWDIVILVVYGVVILGVGFWVSRPKKGEEKDSKDYFLASKSLPWWAIGASLIAANISAEQFIGMSGSGFAMGLAIASYEWMAAFTLLIVGKYFLPVFIEKGLYTIPEFLEKRYNSTVKSILAVFWVFLFVFVNLTTVLFLGAKAIDTIIGTGDGGLLFYAILSLAAFAAAYSLWGGLSAVAWTDVIQVVLLVIGGLITTYIALGAVAPDHTVMGGISYLFEKAPDKFHMILDKDNEFYKDLPGIGVLVGGMWVANIYYWGFNQYIIQRTFAAKSLQESQKGIAFAAVLKMVIPLIVVIPGIIAYVMFQENTEVAAEFTKANGDINYDKAYPFLIAKYVPTGIKGLVLAALAAAIVSSLASMLNSTSTIFTMDIYKPLTKNRTSEKGLVTVGRITALVALIIAVILAPFLENFGQAFQLIQEWTGIVSPGILAIFILGLFWKRTSTTAAVSGAFISIPIALFFKVAPKGWSTASIFPDLPFLTQMGLTFVVTVVVMLIISHFSNKGQKDEKGIDIDKSLFKTTPTFNVIAFAVLMTLTVLYVVFW